MITGKELEAVAYHEAGHAVVAHHYGCKICGVWIDPDKGCGGTRAKEIESPADGGLNEKEIVVLFAGGRAEIRFDIQAKLSVRATNDEGRIDNIIDKYLRPKYKNSKDFDQEIFDKEKAEIEDRLWLEANHLIREAKIWRAVSALAKVLVTELKIDGGKAEDIIRAAKRKPVS